MVVLMGVWGVADARFLSADPVAPQHHGRNFNRYSYANDNPYRFVDPDGRVAIVTHRNDGSVSIQVPMAFSGDRATPENIDAIKAGAAAAFSGTHHINGAATRVDFQVVDITDATPAAARNAVQLIDGPTTHSTGRSFVNAAGGTYGEIDMGSDGIALGEASHELGHFAGAGDHYDYNTGLAAPGFSGNLMAELPGAVDARNITEMLNNTRNIIEREPSP